MHAAAWETSVFVFCCVHLCNAQVFFLVRAMHGQFVDTTSANAVFFINFRWCCCDCCCWWQWRCLFMHCTQNYEYKSTIEWRSNHGYASFFDRRPLLMGKFGENRFLAPFSRLAYVVLYILARYAIRSAFGGDERRPNTLVDRYINLVSDSENWI